jgi:hypothetical protein
VTSHESKVTPIFWRSWFRIMRRTLNAAESLKAVVPA